MRAMKYLVACLTLMQVVLNVSAGEKTYRPDLKAIRKDAFLDMAIPKCDVKMTMMDDGTITLNGPATLSIDLPDDTAVKIECYQKNIDGQSWQTKPSGVFETAICSFLKADQHVVPDVMAASNYPKKCPVNKGEYTLKDCRVGKAWPDDMPGDWWLFKLYFSMNSTVVSEMEAEVYLDKTPRKPKGPPGK